MTASKFSISAASRITKLSRPTITRHIKKGKLSCEVDNEGRKWIQAAELMRAYGDKCDFVSEEERGQQTETGRPVKNNEASHTSAIQEQLIRQTKAENEHLKLALEKALDYQNSVVKLLEDRSKDDSDKWQTTLDAMSSRLTNETEKQISTLQEHHEKELARLKRALRREASKSWLDKLFEKKRVGTRKRR